MPLATLDDLASVGGTATLDDIAAIEPPPSAPAKAGHATLSDIAAIQPPAPPPAIVGPQKPPPMVAQGFTLPESVKVTNPPPAPAPVNPPGYFNPKTGEQTHPGPIGTVPIVDAPGVGIPQAARGVAALAKGVVAPLRTDASGRPVGTPTPLKDLTKPGMLAGASDVIEGGFKTLEPVVAATAAGAPLETAAALAEASAASDIGQRAAKAAGLSPEAQRLAGNVAAFGGGALRTRQVLERLRKSAVPSLQAREASPPPTSAASPAGPPEPGVAHVTDIAAIEPPTGEIHAPGEQGAATVDVRQPPGDGEGVGGGNAEHQGAPGARAPEPEPEHAPEKGAGPGAVQTPPEPVTQDTLDTGEKQPRLPGAEQVRDENKPTPQVAEVPFSLEPESEKRTAVQPTLVEEPHAESAPPAAAPMEERPPAAAAPVAETAAPPVPETPGGSEVAPLPREPKGNRAAPAELTDLHPREVRQLRGILTDLEELPYAKKNFTEAAKGGGFEVSGGAGGARVYYDIVGGSPDRKPPFGYSRGAVAQKLRAFLEQGKRSVASDLAVDVARRQLAGELEGPELPLPGSVHVEARDTDTFSPPVDQVIRNLRNHGDEYQARYRERFGSQVSTDQARQVLAEDLPAEDRLRLNPELQRPAQALADAVRRQILSESTPAGKEAHVAILAGPTGAGKTTALDRLAGGRNAIADAELQLEGTYKNFETARQHVQDALDAGRRVSVIYVHREPGPAYESGVLARRDEAFRPVTPEFHLEAHTRAPEALSRLYDTFHADPRVEFTVVDNTGRPEDVHLGTVDQVRGVRYDQADVRAQLENALQKAPADKAAAIRAASGTGPRETSGGGGRAGAEGGGGEEPAAGDDALSRPLGSRRADASGALIPSPASRVLAGLSKDRQLRPSEIVREISKALDALPINVGKFKQRALGIYKPKEQTIRLKVANDLDTLAHELGHHIHETVMGNEVPPKQFKQELVALGRPTSRPSYSQKQVLQEGQAEFTRYYLSDPAQAQKLAPAYYPAFEQALAKHPQLAAILQRAQRQYVGFLSQDPVTRGLARIDFDGVDTKPKGDLLARLETAWVDDLAPLRRMTQDLRNGQPVNVAADGYSLARLARGASAKADGFLQHGVRDTDGTFIAGALEPALRPVRNQIKEFAAYLVASRVPELRQRGMEAGMSLDEALAIRQKYGTPAFKAQAQAVYDYQDGLLEYAKRSGYLSDQQIAAMKESNKYYVPFQRVLDDVGTALSGGGRGLANTPNAIKRIKGSGRDIINPIESIVKNTHAFVSLVEQNKAMLALVDQARHTVGGGRYLERIPDKQVATTFNLGTLEGTIRQSLAAQGIDLPLSNRNLFDEMVTIFQPTQFRIGERGIVSVLRRGEREWYAVNEPALFDALAAAPPKATGFVYDLLAKPARLLRAGATTTLGFIARNPIRDTFEATVNSRYGFRPGYDTVRGLFAYLEKGDDYQNFLNSGAGNSALVSADRGRVQEELQRLGLGDRKRILDTVVFHPVQLLQAVSEAMEQATRLGEFKRGLDTEGRTPEGFARAALAARDVTVDFARGGTDSKTWNRYVAFFNAGVQGASRVAQVFSRDPIGATMRAAAAITIPSVALWSLNQDDPEYHELPAWERNTYWHIPLGRDAGHAWVRLPKPFSLGAVFGNVPEAALDYLSKKDPEGLSRILPDKNTAWSQFAGWMGTAGLPIYEVMTNYDTFRGRAIVNPYDLGLDKELQYNRWTTEFAKTVGPKIGIAPAVLDHLIYGYGAGFAQGVTKALDPVLGGKSKPSGGPAGWPLVGAFYRDAPRTDAESLQRFYELRGAFAGAEGSVRRYAKSGDTDRAQARLQQLVQDYGGNAAAVKDRIHEADTALKEVRDSVNQVFENAKMTPDQKRDELARLADLMVNLARYGLGEAPLPRAGSGTTKAASPVAAKPNPPSR